MRAIPLTFVNDELGGLFSWEERNKLKDEGDSYEHNFTTKQ